MVIQAGTGISIGHEVHLGLLFLCFHGRISIQHHKKLSSSTSLTCECAGYALHPKVNACLSCSVCTQCLKQHLACVMHVRYSVMQSRLDLECFETSI